MVEVEVPAIFRTVETPGRAVPEIPTFDPFGLRPAANSFSEWFSNLFKIGPKVDETISSQGRATEQLTPKPGVIPSGNAILAGSTVLGTSALLTYTATNPGFQDTTKSVSNSLSPLFTGVGQATGAIGNSSLAPIIIIGGLALAAILLLKK